MEIFTHTQSVKLKHNGIWGWGIYGLDGWGIYGLDGWGIYDLNGWGIYDSNGWSSKLLFLGDVLKKLTLVFRGVPYSSPHMTKGFGPFELPTHG